MHGLIQSRETVPLNAAFVGGILFSQPLVQELLAELITDRY
jgi:hypothetical protein